MTATPVVIQVEPDNELGIIIRRAAAVHGRVVVDTGVKHFELTVGPANQSKIDLSTEGIQKSASGWRDLVDTEKMLAELHESRRAVKRLRPDL